MKTTGEKVTFFNTEKQKVTRHIPKVVKTL